MLKRYALLIILVIGLFVTPFLLHAQESFKPERQRIEKEEQFSINLDSRDVINNQTSINLNDFNYAPPEECEREDIVCFESSIITVHVKKIWELASVLPITDENLETDVFSSTFPDITSNTWEELRINPQELMIAQRTLYERGLMDVLPTGQYGYITEDAVARLQGLKHIQEIDWEKGQVIIGPETIIALNGLKQRMLAPNYFANNPLPQNYDDVLTPELAKRVNELEQRIPNYRPTAEEKDEVEQNQAQVEHDYGYTIKPDGSQLQFQGEAIIEK